MFKIKAINEEIPEDAENDQVINEIPLLRATYDGICRNFQNTCNNEIKAELQELLIKINDHIVIWEKSKSSEYKLLSRLKFGCLNMLVRITTDDEKRDYILQALDVQPGYISLWVSLGLETYTRGILMSSLDAFIQVCRLSPSHHLALKYRFLINCILMNFHQAINIVRHTFEISNNNLLGANMLIFLKTINFPQITGDVESLFSQYNIKYDSLSEPNRDIKWLLSEFKQAFTISPRNIQGSMLTSSSVIESGLLILTKQGSAIDTVYDFALESIKSVCPPLEVNDVAKLTVGSCVDVQVGDLLPKRTEKNHTSYSSGNMIIQLKDLASRLYDVDIQNPTLTPVSNMTNKAHRQVGCTMAIVDQKYNEYIRSPHDAMDIVMYFFKLLMSEVPLYSWTLDLCLKFAFIFINVRGRYMFQLEKYDSSIFSIFLRYIEIYYLVLKNIPMSENQSVQFKFAAKKTLFIIKSHVYGNMLNEEQNSELIIRVLYILSISCDGSSQSICYLSLCQDYQIKYINLFSDDVSSRYTNTIISQDEVAKLISYYEIESVINDFNYLYDNCEYDKAIKFYEKSFDGRFSIILTLPSEKAVRFLTKLVRCYTLIEDDTLNISTIFRILSHLMTRGIKDVFIKQVQEMKIVENIFYRILYAIEILDEADTQSVTNLVILYLVEFLEIDVFLSSNLWYYLFLCFKKMCMKKDLSYRVSFISDFTDLFYLYINKKKICCSKELKPILYRFLKDLNIINTSIDTETSISESLEVYIDCMFYCLSGYPSHRKISQTFEIMKDHPVVDQVISTNNLKYFQFAYNHYKPRHNVSFSLISDCMKSNTKKPLINMDLFKFLSNIGNGLCEIIKDEDKSTLLEISKKYEKCLYGKERWPNNISVQSLSKPHYINDCFDYGLFYFLSEYCIRAMTSSAAVRWILLSIASMSDNYLTWWSCASYLSFKIDEELSTLKCDNYMIPQQCEKLFLSLIFCYNQSFYYLNNCISENKTNLLIDYGWFCYNFHIFLKKGYKFPGNDTLPLKLVKTANRCFAQIFAQQSNCDINCYCISTKYYYLSQKSLKGSGDDVEDIVSTGIKIFENYERFDRNSIIGFVMLLFELCLILWNTKNNSRASMMASQISTYVKLIEKHVNKSEDNVTLLGLTQTINNPSCSQSTSKHGNETDILTQDDDTPLSESKLEFPKDDILFGSNEYRTTAIFGMFHCLNHFPLYYKFIVSISQCFNQLSSEHHQNYAPSFHKLVLYFLTGNIVPILKSSSNMISTLFASISKKTSNQNFLGLFSTNARSGFFRKAWKVNSRFMDDLIMFQNIIFQGTSLLVCVLTELKDSSILLHICANLIKERHNTYMFEEDRMKLINICKEKIIHQLEDLVRLSKHDKSCDDKIILIAHKYYKLPPKIIKDYRARIIEILISFYTQTQHFSSLSSSSHDQKQLLEYATKYAGTLENKILQKH